MKLLVLDGNSILNRAFYGIKLLTTKSGEFTNGIVGFLNILEKVKDETEPDAVAIAFDMKAPTFRHKAYAGYKAQRKGMPPELAAQMPVLKELLGDLGYKIVTCEGWEADDILGTFAETCENTDNTCMIATGDRDSLQLVSPKTTVRLATTKFGQSAVTLCDEATRRFIRSAPYSRASAIFLSDAAPRLYTPKSVVQAAPASKGRMRLR